MNEFYDTGPLAKNITEQEHSDTPQPCPKCGAKGLCDVHRVLADKLSDDAGRTVCSHLNEWLSCPQCRGPVENQSSESKNPPNPAIKSKNVRQRLVIALEWFLDWPNWTDTDMAEEHPTITAMAKTAIQDAANLDDTKDFNSWARLQHGASWAHERNFTLSELRDAFEAGRENQ